VEPHILPLGEAVWKDTRVPLPEHFPAEWEDAITGRAIRADAGLKIGHVLTDFPVALLVSK
jgi:(1->4)-alpha-D-glucan 1-alpha-D-glucosylmutase